MPDLEPLIAGWRRQMLAAGIVSSAVNELEAHLRDDIESLRQSGTDFSEAFSVAADRLGDGNSLGKEFAKTRRFTIPMILASCSLALFVFALFLPACFGVGYFCVVSISIWEISKLATVVVAAAVAAMVWLPVFRPANRTWMVPFICGNTMLAVAVMAAVYTFLFAYRWHINLYFDPLTLGVVAVAAILSVIEGRLLRPRARPMTMSFE